MGIAIRMNDVGEVDAVAAILACLPRPFRRWWSRLPLRSQLSGLILGAGLAATLVMQTVLGAAGGAPGVLMRWAIVLSTVLAMVLAATSLVMRTLSRVVADAKSLVDGEYDLLRTSQRSGSSAEVRELEDVFDALALSIAEREQLVQSEMLQMREVERLKDEFVSTVSHELRTPLTSVRGALGLLLGGPLGQEMPPKARELLRIALSNSERLIRLINDILDVEKMEAGHMSFREERCDLLGILRTTVAGVQGVAHDAGVRLIVEGEPVQVVGDPDRLVQVFTNLVSNAIKASPRGEAVRLRLETHGTVATVQVSDRGPGIPEEFRDRIFGKFQQADAASVRIPGGTGLGLAIARAITEKHAGTMQFETATGIGTTFSVGLPCLAAVPMMTERAASNVTRILVVEQDDSMRSVLEVLCAPLGEVIAVSSAEALTAATQRDSFDAILIDPVLRDGNGLALIRQLRADDAYTSVPVLLFSTREYSAAEIAGVTLAQSHAFVKSRDRESDVVLRLRAVLAVRRPRATQAAA